MLYTHTIIKTHAKQPAIEWATVDFEPWCAGIVKDLAQLSFGPGSRGTSSWCSLSTSWPIGLMLQRLPALLKLHSPLASGLEEQ